MSRVAELVRPTDYMNEFFGAICEAQGSGPLTEETVEQEYDRLNKEKGDSK